MYTNTTQELRSLASDLVHGCRRTAADGTVIYTPDGTASYDGLWLRDFSYMVEYAGFAIPDQDIVNCIRYAVRHRRADGWMPDRVTTDGLAVYAAGIAAAPVGEANLDNTPFLIFTAPISIISSTSPSSPVVSVSNTTYSVSKISLGSGFSLTKIFSCLTIEYGFGLTTS